MARYTKTERVGINAVERIVVDELGWIFREQPIVDMGIDAHIERVDAGNPTGRLVALQIKTGSSHFVEKQAELIYYGSLTHLDYWTGHSLPVILVAHLPDSGRTYWIAVTEDSAQRTGQRWKIAIPKSNVFGPATAKALALLFEGTPAQQRFRTLVIQEPLMRHVQNGLKVSVELEDWINKSLGRTPVKVFTHDKDGNESPALNWYQYYLGFSTKRLAESLFPWAEANVDQDFYDENSEYNRDPDRALFSADEDEGEPVQTGEVHPYREAAGEVEYYRLKLELNELGKAFLVVSDYLSSKNP